MRRFVLCIAELLQAQRLHDLIAILPQGGNANAAAANKEYRYGRDDERRVALLGLVYAGGHLIIHDILLF